MKLSMFAASLYFVSPLFNAAINLTLKCVKICKHFLSMKNVVRLLCSNARNKLNQITLVEFHEGVQL